MKSGLGSRHSVQNDSVEGITKWGLEQSPWSPVSLKNLPGHQWSSISFHFTCLRRKPYLGWGSSKPKSNISIIPFITWAEQ
jgi:hypothetical protein